MQYDFYSEKSRYQGPHSIHFEHHKQDHRKARQRHYWTALENGRNQERDIPNGDDWIAFFGYHIACHCDNSINFNLPGQQ